MSIGVFGGTFDPVHNGHLAVAEEARTQLKLAEIIFVPAGQPWFKDGRPITPAPHRLAMLRLALAGKPYFKLSVAEIERAGPSYTVDTIAELREKLKKQDELFFILGCDSLKDLPRWHDAPRLIKLCYLVAAGRPGCTLPDLDALEASLPGISRRVTILNRPQVDISASDIRERVARGQPIEHLVPAPVERYIKQQGLYLT